MKPLIAITIGDFNGIGPEIALRSAVHPTVRKICQPILVGPLSVFEQAKTQFKIRTKLGKAVFPLLTPDRLSVIDVGDGIWADIKYGTVSKVAGKTAGKAIEHAVSLALQDNVDAIVTSPISKEALNLAGYNFPGQTEMITMLSRSQHFLMMLLSDQMRIGLMTTHTSLATVSQYLTKERIIEKVKVAYRSLQTDFKIKKPRIALLSLNPHGGENGLFGNEENEILKPAIEDLKKDTVLVYGPFSSDSFFGLKEHKKYDAVIAMYHDQGLIPLKMTSFGKGVNFSGGLNIIRTSPDHGTAFDIAGKGKASLTSMIEAIKMATTIAKNRKKRTQV